MITPRHIIRQSPASVLDLRVPHLPDALCAQVDPAIFYPEMGEPTTDAKRVCRACPELAPCLAWALENRERYGVWGATSPEERRNMLRRQKRQAA